MSKITFISGCDSNYYPLLREWLHSVRRFPESESIDINILDAGLTDEQREQLKPLVTSIVNPDWPCEVSASKLRKGEFLKACVCRPFLPQIFPGYDTYFLMDADTWIQNWQGVEMFLQGAQKNAVTLTAQVDRAYPRGGARVKWLGNWPWKVRGFYFSNAQKAYGTKMAKQLMPFHVLLAGAFALRVDAPHWDRWQTLVIETMSSGKVFTAEQLSLGRMCYLEDYAYEILPAWTHWLCEAKPLWDTEKQVFIEKFLPHHELGILHISGFDEMRLDRKVTTDFKTADGENVDYTYRYPFFDGETLEDTDPS